MIHVEVKDLYKREHVLLWSLLAFKAGLLNAAGFLIAGSYVSHVTGFSTQMAILLEHRGERIGAELMVIPMAFIGGGVITTWILDKDYEDSTIPHYPRVQFLITLLLGVVSALSFFGFFSKVEPLAHGHRSMILIGLLCLICGLKNSLSTWASHGKIRTTHITGLATDIGLHLLKTFRPSGSKSRFPERRRVNQIRMVTLLSFSVGSYLAAMLIPRIGNGIFYIAFVISVGLLIISVWHRKKVIKRRVAIP